MVLAIAVGIPAASDPRCFEEISSLYYKNLKKLYGKADFYSMDPFHEGRQYTAGVDLDAAGKAVISYEEANPAVWVAQAWRANHVRMIEIWGR